MPKRGILARPLSWAPRNAPLPQERSWQFRAPLTAAPLLQCIDTTLFASHFSINSPEKHHANL